MGRDDYLEPLLLALFAAVATAAAASWLGAAAAVAVTGGGGFTSPPDVVVRALIALPPNAADPAAAWGEWGSEVPAAELYWPISVVVAAVLVTVVVRIGMVLQRWWVEGLGGDRRRLGVDTRARLAELRDLRTLVVKRAKPGRWLPHG